jgi:Protein of unknown function (DUF2924)
MTMRDPECRTPRATTLGARRRSPALPVGLSLSSASDIDSVVAELEQAPRTALADRWRSLYRCNPPKGVGRRLLIGAIAHELQLRQAGRKRSSVLRRLQRQAATQSSSAGPDSAGVRKLQPGARLIRDWNGSTHTVDVVEDGFVWNGARYRSLSAIARAITGARWSGPRFFGLNREGAR